MVVMLVMTLVLFMTLVLVMTLVLLMILVPCMTCIIQTLSREVTIRLSRVELDSAISPTTL